MINHRSGAVKFLKLDRISSKGKTLLSELETDHPRPDAEGDRFLTNTYMILADLLPPPPDERTF